MNAETNSIQILKKTGLAGGLFMGIIFAILYLHFYPDLSLELLKEKYTYSDSDFQQVMGMNVHYVKEGEGPVLLLLHGTGASLHTWEKWTELLKNDFTVISLDLPAFGLTGPAPSRDYSIESYVAFLNQFVESQELDSFYLAGNSLGGFIGWRYASTYPEKVKKMLLLAPAGIPHDRPLPLSFRLARNKWTAKILLTITPKLLFRKSLKEVYADDSKVTTELVQRYFDLFRRPGNRQAYIDRAKILGQYDLTLLKKVTTPTLILWGEEDLWIPVSNGQKFLDRMQNAELIVYPGVGHVPMEEIPTQTALEAARFFK